LCPKRMDFSFSWGLPVCELYKEGEPESRKVNQFLVWSGEKPEGWPELEDAK